VHRNRKFCYNGIRRFIRLIQIIAIEFGASLIHFIFLYGTWLRHYATGRMVTGSNPDDVIGIFNWPNPSSRTMALGSTQPLTEISTRILSGCKGRLARKADNLTAIYESIVQKMWESRRLTNLWAFTACYRDSFIFFYLSKMFNIMSP
jgi:hypothetical protein